MTTQRSLAAALVVLAAVLGSYFFLRPRNTESPAPTYSTYTIPLEVSAETLTAQNGQPLTNEQSVQGSQSLQNPGSVDQSAGGSNLQGSPSPQQAAPAKDIPSDWLK